MKILVVGSGGREHALCWALRRTPTVSPELFCAPGNAGIAQVAECAAVSVHDLHALANFAEEKKIDLTMVGPEAPLADGIVDLFEQRQLRIVGPRRQAAQLESSKAFAKDFMRRHAIPTARYRVVESVAQARDVLDSGEFGDESKAVVIKADGLAAGKGVYVAADRKTAFAALAELTSGAVGPQAARRIIIEEALAGKEVSLLLFSDGKDFRLMPAARDHKRVGDNDTGPNTGGMGSITDASILDDVLRDQIVREVVQPTLQGCRDEGMPFRGILFVGLMLTPEGPSVLEYNVRFGDPETQAILVRLKTDLTQIFHSIADTRLGEIQIDWSAESSACVVLASRGYPTKAETGDLIQGLDAAAQHEHVAIFHAATALDEKGYWRTAGGRVLGVTATGETLDQALDRCYGAVSEIHWEGLHFRRDIGKSVVREARTSG